MTESVRRQSTAALEYVPVIVRAKKAGAFVNPTANTVTMAFMTTGAAPTAPDWKAAIWDTDATTSPATYTALCLVGPGGTVTLTAGTYRVWVKVTDSPETPVKESYKLVVY